MKSQFAPITKAVRRLVFTAACLLPVIVAAPAAAQGFSAVVSPPRFEASAKPGATYRDVIEISNVSRERSRFTLHTADWALDANGGAEFSDALAPASCRPWVGIEAPEIVLAGNSKRRYRFEVAVPADAPSGECRFAIMIEGDPTPAAGAVAVPVAGRIAVIVYLTVGDAQPRLEVTQTRVEQREGHAVPVLSVHNGGNAHGRLDGLIDAVDAGGRRVALAPTSNPILAGETRPVALLPQADAPDQPVPELRYPLRLKGRLEWGKQHLDIDTTLQP